MTIAKIDPAMLAAMCEAIDARLARTPDPLIVGIAGSQGSGKTTIAAALAEHFSTRGVPTAMLSIDDLYLTRAERETLAREVHPLLRTRGVPGTHDVALGLELLDGFKTGVVVAVPRFDKAIDDRSGFEPLDPETRLLIFEGWCLGAKPVSPGALVYPVNDLERIEDRDGRWRAYVNTALGGAYQRLFAKIDYLIFLAAPGFDVVLSWRREAEQAIRRAGGGMDDAELTRFVDHYQRVTEAMLADLPASADMTFRLDDRRRPRHAG